MNEKIISFGEYKSLTGILTTPDSTVTNIGYCVIILNSGLVHKVGLNCFNVKLSRSIAESGIPSFRFDFSGFGDSEFINYASITEKNKLDEIRQAIDIVISQTGINKFYISGICSGAENAFKFSIIDDRIIGIILIDGQYYDKAIFSQFYLKAVNSNKFRYYKKKLFCFNNWIKILTGKSNVFTYINFVSMMNIIKLKTKSVLKVNNSKKISNQNITINISEWELLFIRGVHVFLIFFEGGIYIDIFNMTIEKQLKKHHKNNLLTIELIKDVDHSLTPIWSQMLVIKKIKNWLLN